MVNISKYISRDLVCVYRDNESKPFILEKIADLVVSSNKELIGKKKTILTALQERERLGSTGLTRGVALPHCRFDGVKDFILGILVSPQGVAYGSLDGRKSYVFFFVIAPKESGAEYLNLMAEVGSFLSNEERVKRLSVSRDSEELFQTFLLLWEEYFRKETHKE